MAKHFFNFEFVDDISFWNVTVGKIIARVVNVISGLIEKNNTQFARH